jgi:tetratricopeptide (TPR) repeat protein
MPGQDRRPPRTGVGPKRAGQRPARPVAKGSRPSRRPAPSKEPRPIEPGDLAEQRAAKAGLGRVARRGASVVVTGRKSKADPDRGPRRAQTQERWVDEGPVRAAAATAVRRARSGPGRPARRPSPDLVAELASAASPRRAGRLAIRVAEARTALYDERFGDAAAVLGPIVREAPGSATARELYGLALYGAGRYRSAAEHLEAHRAFTGSVEELHVLADCYRALKRWALVEELWNELRESSPSAELVAEGRIVMAGSLADRGRLRDAIALLEAGPLNAKRSSDHHLRLWYALADLYERAGDVPRARALFTKVMRSDSGFPDVAERLAAMA